MQIVISSLLPPSPRTSNLRLNVDTELVGDELDDMRWQHLGIGQHAHLGEFLSEGLAPVHQGID